MPRAPVAEHSGPLPVMLWRMEPSDQDRGSNGPHDAGASPRTREDAYTAPQAAGMLGLSDRRVRQMLEAGEMEGNRDRSGRWWIPPKAIEEMLEERGSPRGRRYPSDAPSRSVGAAPLSQAPEFPENFQDLVSRVEDLSYRLGRSEARLDLVNTTESAIREERDRLSRELEEEREERRRLTERLGRLLEERREPAPEEPLEPDEGPEGSPPPAPTGENAGDEPRDERGWWRRFFGFGHREPPEA